VNKKKMFKNILKFSANLVNLSAKRCYAAPAKATTAGGKLGGGISSKIFENSLFEVLY
jgi:hypothetical protein